MENYYLDAGTTYSKIICCAKNTPCKHDELISKSIACKQKEDKYYYVLLSQELKGLNLKFKKACGHMGNSDENEIIALAQGARKFVADNATILDMGSRDAKWIKFQDGKFTDMDWNTSCASSTGATVEMLLKFYNVKTENLEFTKEKFAVTCGIFGLEKIMDEISKGCTAENAISKFIHGIAFNAWNFAKKPEKLYLSGGFCENKCFVDSLKNYCEVTVLGRYVLCEGLIEC